MAITPFVQQRYSLSKLPLTKPHVEPEVYSDLFALYNTVKKLLQDLDTAFAEVGGGGIPDAPIDGTLYGRKDGAWEAVPTISISWGDIGGTLSDQTDLQAELDGKEPTIASGLTTQFLIGDKTWSSFGTAVDNDTTDFATAAQGATADTAVQPGDLATVAFSGDYADLSGAPAAGIPEAPNDGTGYVRKSLSWVAETSGGGIPEAPNDGQQYARQSLGWSVVSGGGGGIGPISSVVVPQGTSTLSVGTVASILKLESTAPARIRLYCTSVGRTADASRAVGVQATNDVGLILEFIADVSILGADLNPVPTAHNGDTPTTNSYVYYNIEPVGATTDVTFTYLTLLA